MKLKPHIRIGRAFVAGLTGALAVAALTGVLRLLGAPLNFELMLGSMLFGTLGPVVWLVGLGLLLLAGGISGLIYAAIFEYGMRAADAGIGTTIGAVHAVISGIALAFVPDFHPLMPSVLPAPGLFLLGLGAWGVVLFLGLHIVFGAIVGSFYGVGVAAPELPIGRGRLHTRP